MYNLLIVEDDPVILSRLQNSFDWKTLGYTVCGTASDGQSALQLIPTLLPDVVLTDVEMPVMSGLELARQISKMTYPIKVVFLSAYDDFRYAREAFRLGAVDYLLKPLHQEDVTQLFLKIAEELKKDRQAFTSQQIMQISKKDSFRQVVFNFLLGHPCDLNHICFLLQHFGLVNVTSYTLAAFCFVENTALETVQTALTDFCADHSFIPLVYSHQRRFVLLFPGARQAATQFMADFLSSRSGWQCVLTEDACLSDLPLQFSRIWNQPCGWFYCPMDQISFLNDSRVSDCVSSSSAELPGPDHYYPCVRDQNQARFLHLLNRQAQLCQEQYLDVDLCIIHMAETYIKTAAQLQIQQPKLESISFGEIFHELQGCFCFQSLEKIYRSRMLDLMESYAQLCDQKGELIEQVQRYIKKHYAENLTLQELSNKFYVSPSYLSYLFSQRTTMTITTYLQQVRMEQAACLLRQTTMSIAEIGIAVGYGNYKNFWKLFKRHFNVTPKEYRNLHNT